MIEIQIHPSDIRRRVRYLFFDRRRVVVAIVAGWMLLAGLIASMAAAPTVIRRVYKTNFLREQREERDIERSRLQENVAQMATLARTLEEQRIRVEKLTIIYGLDRSLGQGGLPDPLHLRLDTTNLQLADAQRREAALLSGMRRLQHQLDELARYESANAELVRHTPSILPLPQDQFVLTSPFGTRISPFTKSSDFHKGLDLSAPTGTPVFATADGTVTFAGRYPLSNPAWWRFGNVVVIDHGSRFLTIYGHCDTVRVKSGDTVKQGQSVATVGSTGWSTNSHLHYEVRSDLEEPGNFQPVDPRIYILNYQWNNEAQILMRARTAKEYKNFDPLPLPQAFLGRRRE